MQSRILGRIRLSMMCPRISTSSHGRPAASGVWRERVSIASVSLVRGCQNRRVGRANRDVGGTAAAVDAGLRSPTNSPPPCPTLRIPSAPELYGHGRFCDESGAACVSLLSRSERRKRQFLVAIGPRNVLRSILPHWQDASGTQMEPGGTGVSPVLDGRHWHDASETQLRRGETRAPSPVLCKNEFVRQLDAGDRRRMCF